MMDSIRGTLLWSITLLVMFVCRETFSDVGKVSSGNSQNHLASSVSHFTTKNNTRVIAQKGGLAILPCAVKLNSPATVSWIRRRDFQLLTVGLSTHSSDGRFLVEHTRHMGHWSLRIKSVRDEDRGLYECQLSIYPTQSIFVELKVVEAVAEITGSPDLHIDEGSTLRLECKLKRATENPSYVFWFHDNKMVNYDKEGGFSVTEFQNTNIPPPAAAAVAVASATSPSSTLSSSTLSTSNNNLGSSNNYTSNVLTIPSSPQQSYLITPSSSILTIKEVHFHHAGNYTCKPSNARPASINVHVLRGEKPAAMQHANRSTVEEGKSKSNSFRCRHSDRQPFWFLTILSLICTYHKINR